MTMNNNDRSSLRSILKSQQGYVISSMLRMRTRELSGLSASITFWTSVNIGSREHRPAFNGVYLLSDICVAKNEYVSRRSW